MKCCCSAPSGYEDLFSEAQARRDARRYRRKGLDRPARWIVEAVRQRGVEGRTVLEPGGGIGAIQLELLKAGASHSLIVELSAGYDDAAAGLANEAGLEGRLERRLGDFAADEVSEADVVVLHRVVCCYPDYEGLLGAAAGKARSTLVFTYPPRNPLSRLATGALNLWLRLRGSDFRTFTHPPGAMAAVVEREGFEPFARRHGGIWRGLAFSRTA
jgi:magnesium-protoporphyrin O-methyltransferase